MRILGVDFGQRRIGLSLSDTSATLARPWKVIPAGATLEASAASLAEVVSGQELGRENDGEVSVNEIAAIVIGLPRRLNGEDTEQTEPARQFARAVQTLTGLDVHLQDERLSSHEAETRLAEREPDWRRRKAKLDAASAAIILQDFLDERARLAERERLKRPC